MDISKQFSFTDFLAYFFPGTLSVLGIYLLVILTPAQYLFRNISFDITTGISFIVISYVVGVVSSGFSSSIVRQIEKWQQYKDVRKIIPFDDFQDDIVKAFQDVFGKTSESKPKWSRNHYYLCRSLVSEKMPAISLRADRQSNLALFRRNLILPLFIWFATGY